VIDMNGLADLPFVQFVMREFVLPPKIVGDSGGAARLIPIIPTPSFM